MKIGGRSIRQRCITKNTDKEFECVYKGHSIHVTLLKEEFNNEYYLDVRSRDGRCIVQTTFRTFEIRYAIIEAFDGALL